MPMQFELQFSFVLVMLVVSGIEMHRSQTPNVPFFRLAQCNPATELTKISIIIPVCIEVAKQGALGINGHFWSQLRFYRNFANLDNLLGSPFLPSFNSIVFFDCDFRI